MRRVLSVRTERYRRMRRVAVGCALLGLSAALLLPGWGVLAYAADWPQWRGPARNGVSAEQGWSAQWPPAGPRRLWSAPVGEGWSSFAVVGGRVYTAGNANNQDTVYCLNADNGQAVWRYSYPAAAGD